MWPAARMVEAARWVQIAGFGLPVAANALTAAMLHAPATTTAAANRHGRWELNPSDR